MAANQHPVESESPPQTTTPQSRVLGTWAAFSIVAGSMLGVGIFLFPGRIAQQIQDPMVFLGLWLLGGIIALAGAVACGELGAMMPQAGGDYTFHREALGPSAAFASGWVLFGAIFPGSIASMAVAVFYYQVGALFGVNMRAPLWPGWSGGPISVSLGQGCALLLIAALTLLNVRGARDSGRFQTVLTLGAMLVLLVLAGLFFMFGGGHPTPYATPANAPALTMGTLIAALLMVYFAYSGWLNIIYVAGEVRNPGKEIPRSMLWGTGAVTALYLLLCTVFFGALGVEGLRKAGAGWIDAGTASVAALGITWLGKILLVIIAAVILTSINATILAGARVAFAMAQKGAFWRPAAGLNRHEVPATALWLQAGIAGAFVLSGTFDNIVAATSIAMLVTGTLTVLALFILRHREPDRKRDYKAWGFPWFPGLYLAFSLLAIGVKCSEIWSQSHKWKAWLPLCGVAVFAAAWAYHALRHRESKE